MKSNQAPKKVSILRERVQKALWFAKSFGIQFTEIKGADKNGKIYDLLNEKQSTNYTSFSRHGKRKIKIHSFYVRLILHLRWGMPWIDTTEQRHG